MMRIKGEFVEPLMADVEYLAAWYATDTTEVEKKFEQSMPLDEAIKELEELEKKEFEK